ncbi:Spy/CpxP family protein refolding chaperone [Microvirga terricola]|uniref:LTXXQ motif family protein n=1 Tax=Microvirga terricola TaxID=2719797 RepID=A0ABX0VB48_9HYPH|nr:Spy/CpxP family protein refolding chaperone [Microvirga terricola]NIX76556.1 LTXXQ motif family protein [Microvirga terricola]
MKTFAILSAASALALAGTLAYAQPAPPPAGGPRAHEPMSRADVESLTDARIAGIQAGLKLTPDQQKLWPPVEKALRSISATRAERMEAFRARANAKEHPDLMARLDRAATFSTKNGENLTALSTAMKPFWASLDDRQKKLLPVLMHEGRGGRMAAREHWRMEHHGGMQGQQPAAPKQ